MDTSIDQSNPLPLIAVVGSTGIQGGSVVKHLLESHHFGLRGLTRQPDSEKADSLRRQGVEVVKADLDDIESLRKAFRGCYGVFAVTNCWEHGWDAETRQGINMVDAAKAEGVQHFAWSTMEHSGDLDCWHFESKARVNDYLIKSGLGRTSLYTAAYYENFEMQLRPKRHSEGNETYYTINFNHIPPDSKFFAFSGSDIGGWVCEAFKNPNKYLNRDLKLVVEWLTVKQMATTASRVSGLDVRAEQSTLETLEQSRKGGEIFEDLYRMTRYYIENQPPTNIRNQDETLKIYPQALTWEAYVKRNAKQIFL